jgi:signal transduction histidine kinase
MEVLRQVKDKNPEIEVILLTGHSSIQDGVKGIKLNAFDYLTKPIQLEHLVSKINQAYAKILREEEKLKEAAFKARMEQQMIACERLASLGTLAAGVAHEINNPLAIIGESAGWIKSLLQKPEFSAIPRRADFEKAVSKIEGGIERARHITHQLLGFVAKQDSVPSEVRVEELMREALDLVKKEALQKDIRMEAHCEPKALTIWSDPYQLRQVLLNLLTNAIHATGAGGSIMVNAGRVDDGFRLTVRDAGPGIPKENLERIFQPFFSTKPPGEGTGLGLFVSRRSMERIGGTLEVESRLGQGTSFHVILPKKDLDGTRPGGKG